MYLRVKYANHRYDYIPDFMLDSLIARLSVVSFYRPSEHRWVIVGEDPIRDATSPVVYSGFLRRRSDILL